MPRKLSPFVPLDRFENLNPKLPRQSNNYFNLGEKLLKFAREGNEKHTLSLLLAAKKLKKQKGIDVEAVDVNYQNLDSGESALMLANSTQIVKILLKYGADPNLQDNYGNSALHYHSDNPFIAATLLENGAFPFIKNLVRENACDCHDMFESSEREVWKKVDFEDFIWPLASPRFADLEKVIALEIKTVQGLVPNKNPLVKR